MMKFDSAVILEIWLRSRGIDTGDWGTTGSKTITNLWQEYEQGEITFRDNPPTRIVRVVQIILRRDDLVLYELAQEFDDGRLRRRRQPPSEKIIAGESQYAAAERCLTEELGLDPRAIHLLGSSADALQNIAESPSYPGLHTHYTIYTIEAMADGLPETDFWRENEAAGESDPVKRHLWGWRRGL
jgi:ADP-ribose pyrophosphatase YjhB (NUDIX family)